MIDQEIKKAIENSESVWACRNNIVYKVALDSSWVYIENDILKWYSPVNKILGHKYYSINELYKTKAEAEHYLHHANVTRLETLPFLTWEEFKEGKELRFYNGKYRYKMNWSVDPEIIVIKRYLDFDIDEFIFNERLTEENFYKAYDECVRLFKGEV